MSDRPVAARAETTPTGERSSASLLVRCWLEPSGVAGEPPALRGYVKNLKTGEETFFKDFDAVSQQIQRSLLANAPVDAPESTDAATLFLSGRR
jgi:hypothetical protein